MIGLDFSENYTIIHQEEVQSLYFGKMQITLHSYVLIRPTTPADETDKSHVKEYWIMISNDIKHDIHFVHHCWVNIIMPQLHAL